MDRVSRRAFLTASALACLGLVILLCCLALSTAEPVAWADSGGFQGTVTDVLTGRPIVGAQVSAGDLQITTDGSGHYRLRVAPATYRVLVRAGGYIGMSMPRQTATHARIITIDFEMVISEPSDEQQLALDAIFRQHAGSGRPSPEELEEVRARGFVRTGAIDLPETIRVKMPDGSIDVMEIEEYLRGVVPYEMAPSWPPEALRAQAVAARCYAANAVWSHSGQNWDVDTTENSQVWRPPPYYATTDQSVARTRGVAATYDGTVIGAYYHGHCDGHTRNSEDVWVQPLPYCRSVVCPCGFGYLYGHGVGMCQWGAHALAKQGYGYREILGHYYAGTEVTEPPPPTLSDGQVTPVSGDTATMFTYRILYDGSDPPIAAHVYINGYSYPMAATSDPAPDGTWYSYSTPLSLDEYSFVFSFDNGYSPMIRFPTSGTLSGPTVGVTATVEPTPTPTPEGTYDWQWSQTTGTDFADGTYDDTILPPAEGNDKVQLAPGAVTGSYTSIARAAPVDFVAVGSNWNASVPTGTAITVAVRAGPDGSNWSDWVDIELMDAEREQALLSYGELVLLRGPYVQYRLTLVSDQPPTTPALHSLTMILINSQDGPIAQGARASAADPSGAPTIIAREEWGANESLMTVSWPPEYRPVEMFVIHHTVTPNDGVDPYATVRAIYYYHGVSRGWGDIGYNYLIDAQGRIYEGRAGGERVEGQQLEAVVGGHAKIYNWGSIGIAVLGNYEEQEVPDPAIDSLTELIAWKANQHLVDPTGYGYVFDEYLPTIAGHRDVGETTCPGQYLYSRLDTVRTDTWTHLLDLVPVVRIGRPLSTEPASSLVDVLVSASPQAYETVLLLDGQQKHSESSDRLVWRWNSTGSADGPHTLRAEVSSASGRTGTDEITVTVDNTPPGGSLDGPEFTNAPTITLSTWSDNALKMAFSNSWLWEGEDLRHEAQAGALVSDPDAWNGHAWMGRAGTDTPGWWFGPYYKDLPTAHRYRVYFRLNVADNTTSAEVATIDVVDDEGGHTYVSRALTGLDFVGQRVYQEPYLDFYYAATDEHGLEFRTYFPGTSDLYLDRVHLFCLPRSYTTHAEWILPEGDGSKVVEARYIDGAGNLSSVYTTTIVLDTVLAQWQGWDGAHAWVRDDLSGLHVSSAQYAASTDHGQSWGDWQTATITATEGSTDAVPLCAPSSGVTNLRFRIEDRAGNLSESAVYDLDAPTPTPTVTPIPGSVRGRMTMQGRTRHDGAEVSITDIVSTTTDENGAYSLAMVPPGVYSVTVKMAGYLETHRQGITVSSRAEIDMPDVTLRGGDANNDCIVDLLDLVIVSYSFDQSPPADDRADINQDGRVDIFDLVLVTSNYDLECPGPWPEEGGSAATGRADASAALVLRVNAIQIAEGDTLRLDILARDAVDLAGVDLLLHFDPQLLRARDMDEGAGGVQMQPLFAAPYDGHVARNSVDNELGAIRYAAAVLRPAPPANGQVFIASAEFEALDNGIVHFECHDVTLLDTQVKPLRVAWTQESAVFLPCLLKSE